MKLNLNSIERGFRVILGMIFGSFAFFGPENLWFLVGLYPLITGTLGVCPVYKLYNITSR